MHVQSIVSATTNDVQREGKVEQHASHAELLARLKNITTTSFNRADSVLKKSLESVQPIALTDLLNQLFKEMLQEGRLADPTLFLDQLASLVPLDVLQEAVKGDMGGCIGRS